MSLFLYADGTEAHVGDHVECVDDRQFGYVNRLGAKGTVSDLCEMNGHPQLLLDNSQIWLNVTRFVKVEREK